MPEACIYTRISNDPDAETDDGGMGVARQEKDCRGLADRLDWTVARVHSDNDLSAYDGKVRPGFEEMLDAIRRGEYDGLICWNTDRLVRRMDDLERLIEACDGAGVMIKSVTSGELDVSTANGKMLARMLAAVARQESEHKSERQKRANIQRAEGGSWWSTHRVFGYNRDTTIREDEAQLIRQAAADVLIGMSMRAIARGWDQAGVRTVRGAAWDGRNLRKTLMNPRYAGLRTYHGKVVGPGSWEPILDHDTHAGVVAVLSDPSRSTSTVRYERKYMGSRRYVCGLCGAKLQHAVTIQSNRTKVYHRYICTAAAHMGRTQPELDAYVEAVALEQMRDAKTLKRILAATTKSSDGDPVELRSRRNALQAQKDELATLFTDGVLDGPAVRRESAKLQSKISVIDAALAEMARRSPLADLLAEGTEKLDQRWREISADMRGKIIDELFTVVVHPSPTRGRYFNPDAIEFVPVRAR